jgi:hypothetical protein
VLLKNPHLQGSRVAYVTLKESEVKSKLMFVLCAFFLFTRQSKAQQIKLPEQQDRWKIQTDGSIEWKIDNRIPHFDHIEMAGEKVALWMQYGVDSSGRSKLSRTTVFPTFRLLPHRTIAHMTYNLEDAEVPRIYINDRLLKRGVHNAALVSDLQEKVQRINHEGIMVIESELRDSVRLRRVFFPCVDKPVAIEKLVFINGGKRPQKLIWII